MFNNDDSLANKEEILNQIKVFLLTTNSKQESPRHLKNVFNIEKFSSLLKLYRLTAWISRFINNINESVRWSHF